SSHLDGVGIALARRLKQVASIIRYDASSPSSPIGARFFHVRLGGFDTHTQQGTLTGSQPVRLQRIAASIKAFYDDMVSLGVAGKCLMMTFSEFGRRVAENGSAGTAGTDHGAAPAARRGPLAALAYGRGMRGRRRRPGERRLSLRPGQVHGDRPAAPRAPRSGGVVVEPEPRRSRGGGAPPQPGAGGRGHPPARTR